METNTEPKISDRPTPTSSKETDFILQLTPIQRQAYLIAVDHLKTSFDLSRSNGFVDWTKKHPTK